MAPPGSGVVRQAARAAQVPLGRLHPFAPPDRDRGEYLHLARGAVVEPQLQVRRLDAPLRLVLGLGQLVVPVLAADQGAEEASYRLNFSATTRFVSWMATTLPSLTARMVPSLTS